RMCCASVNRRVPHPGNRHSPSRWRSVRIIAGEGSLELRPRRRGFPPESSITICSLPEHSRRLAVSAWVTPPPSTSHPPSPLTTSSSRACTTTSPSGACVRSPGSGGEYHQGVGASSIDEELAFLAGHRRNL